MTEKLYYIDSHLHEFTARVAVCEECGGEYLLELDRTAFFPEGGGQAADTGHIGPARVRDTQERQGRILHYADSPLDIGREYACAIDYEQRLGRMQNHSGEHIVSGLTHSLFGLDNVGFHMGQGSMTIDFNGELDRNALEKIETLANRAVRDNIPVRTMFPDAEALKSLEYRSKLALTENVRIVEIEGIDRCACCAPHVAHTGEIGIIKILDAERHRGGTRISLACGMDALADYRCKQENVTAISEALSAKKEQTAAAVERLLLEQARVKQRIAELSMEAVRLRAAAQEPREGNLCVFDDVLDEIALRELVNLLMDKCTGLAAAFSGSDEEGYRYIIGSRHVDLRAALKTINSGIGGRGGGSPSMIQGRAAENAETIQKFVVNFKI